MEPTTLGCRSNIKFRKSPMADISHQASATASLSRSQPHVILLLLQWVGTVLPIAKPLLQYLYPISHNNKT